MIKIKEKIKDILISLIIFILLVAIVANPSGNMDSFTKGLNVWATVVLPALFPFFLLTKILCELNVVADICKIFSPITKKLFNCDGISSYIFLMSIISGYPVGAKLVSDFYSNNQISSGQAHRIITFTSTSGPLFIIGTIGTGLFKSTKIGLIILLSHFISALLNGLIYRNYKLNSEDNSSKIMNSNNSNKNILSSSMISSINSIMVVGGYIAIFFVIINLVNEYNIFKPFLSLFNNNQGQVINAILNGIIEVTRGCFDLSKLNLNLKATTIISTALITFGGFSIHMQAFTFLKTAKIKYSFFFLQKTTQTIISIIISFIFTFLFL